MRPRMGFALVRTSLCVSVCAPVSKAAIGEAPLITCLVAPVQLWFNYHDSRYTNRPTCGEINCCTRGAVGSHRIVTSSLKIEGWVNNQRFIRPESLWIVKLVDTLEFTTREKNHLPGERSQSTANQWQVHCLRRIELLIGEHTDSHFTMSHVVDHKQSKHKKQKNRKN